MKKKILVFGANGFIGRNVVRFFSNDLQCEVWGTYRKGSSNKVNNVRYIYCDLNSPVSIEGHFDAVIDCVSQVEMSSALNYINNTVIATQNVVDFCERSKVNTLIFMSSISVYGITKTEVDEMSPYFAVDNYGLAKLMSENIIFQSSLPNVFSLRCPRILGVGVNYNHQWLPALAYKLNNNIDIHYYNKDLLYNNMLHVSDLTEFCKCLVENYNESSGTKECILLGTSNKMSIYDIIIKLREYLKSSSRLIQEEDCSSTTVFSINIQKAVKYGFKAMNIQDTLQKFALDVWEENNE